MDTKNIIMIVLFFLLGISFIVFIVRAFIKWENRRKRNMSFLMAFFLFILLVGNGIYLLVTFVRYAKDKGTETVNTISTELLTESYSESSQLKRIREMQPKLKHYSNLTWPIVSFAFFGWCFYYTPIRWMLLIIRRSVILRTKVV